MCIGKTQYARVQLSAALFEDKINAMRRMVHRVCKLTGSSESCPYRDEYGEQDLLACETCPMNKERHSEA